MNLHNSSDLPTFNALQHPILLIKPVKIGMTIDIHKHPETSETTQRTRERDFSCQAVPTPVP